MQFAHFTWSFRLGKLQMSSVKVTIKYKIYLMYNSNYQEFSYGDETQVTIKCYISQPHTLALHYQKLSCIFTQVSFLFTSPLKVTAHMLLENGLSYQFSAYISRVLNFTNFAKLQAFSKFFQRIYSK